MFLTYSIHFQQAFCFILSNFSVNLASKSVLVIKLPCAILALKTSAANLTLEYQYIYHDHDC